MLTYSDAQALMESARDQSKGKPLANNTRLYNRGPRVKGYRRDDTPIYEKGDTFAVQLHATDVVEIHPDGTYTLNTGGWDTVTTWDRIRQYAPHWGGRQIYDRKLGGKRFLMTPNSADPEPRGTPRQIPPVFQMSDPGPEPVKSPDGCWVGHTHTWTELNWDEREVSRVVTYIEKGNWWALNDADVIGEAKQCPHCKEFDERHRRWDSIMHGYRNRKVGLDCGYKRRAEMLEKFGDEAAWKQAALEDHRRVAAERIAWREWAERNTVEMYDGIILDSDGFADRKAAERAKRLRAKEHRAFLRRQKGRQKEYEKLLKKQEAKRAEKERLVRIEAERIEAELREKMGVDYHTEPGALTWLADHGVEINA